MTKEELEREAKEYSNKITPFLVHMTAHKKKDTYSKEQLQQSFTSGADYGYIQGQIKNYSDLCNQRKLIYQELVKVFTDQLGILDKEDDELFSLNAIKEIIHSVLRED